MSDYLKGPARSQVLMLPECVEDYVGQDNPVRAIEAFVAALDLASLEIQALPQNTGRPGYDPRDLLGLYIYGYLHRMRSSRDLERQTHRNLEVVWLLRGLRPDHKTISEFRRQHAKSFKGLLRQFNLLCRQLDLFGRELVAIDGTLFKAVNSRSRNHTARGLRQQLKRIDAGIESYLRQAEESDRLEEQSAGSAQKPAGLQEKLQSLRARKGRCQKLLEQMQSSGEKQISLTDSQSRLMQKSAGSASIVAYNVQTAVDAKHHLMVVAEATNAFNDFGQLGTMALAAKNELQVEHLEVLADGGYRNIQQVAQCEAAGISTYLPALPDAQAARGLFGREAFVYDAGADAFRCPGAQQLRHRHVEVRRGQRDHMYANYAACRTCSLRSQCTRGRFRKIKRTEGHEVLDAAVTRAKLRPDIYALRKTLVEHPFGTLKFWWGQGAFLLRGLHKVNAEVQLSALAYNLRRMLNILGTKGILEHLRAKKALLGARPSPSWMKKLRFSRFFGSQSVWSPKTLIAA